MTSGIESLDRAYGVLFVVVLILMAVLAMLCLVRAIIGPRTADRIVSVNMMGTMVIVMIAVLALMLGEGYLVDICLIYAMISFLAVIVLTKVYMGVYLEKKELEGRKQGVRQREEMTPESVKADGINAEAPECERETAESVMLDGGKLGDENLKRGRAEK